MTSPSPSNATELILGAVAYDQKVVPIWDGFQQYFRTRGLPFDYVLFSNYERQVEAHLRGHVHVAWNSPLAWLQTERIAARLGRRAEAICMRDTRSRPPQRDPGPVGRRHRRRRRPSRQDRRGGRARLSAGHADPVEPPRGSGTHAGSGLRGPRVRHPASASTAITSAASATPSARYSAARPMPPASSTRTTWRSRERGPSRRPRPESSPRPPGYDHCNFTVIDGVQPEKVARFRELLLAMSYGDADVRPLLDLEGLKAWVPGRVTRLRAALRGRRSIRHDRRVRHQRRGAMQVDLGIAGVC